MRPSKRLLFALLASVSATGWARVQATVTVTYSSAQSVPMSGAALALFALLLAVLAHSKLRGKASRLLSLVLAVGLLGVLAVSKIPDSLAMQQGATINLSSANPASGTGFEGVWLVNNDLSTPATLLSITATGSGYSLDSSAIQGYITCAENLQLAPYTTCAITVVYTPLPG